MTTAGPLLGRAPLDRRGLTPPSAIGPDPILAAFARALSEAEAFAGATAPNPAVGCVILDATGRELAVAAHEKAGQDHAEAAALSKVRAAGLADRIHTVVVTLEPCNHHGRTPPCVEAILASGAQEVWIGALDPNPRVAGGGARRLAAAGLRVRRIETLGRPGEELAAQAARLIAPFAVWSLRRRPFLTVKRAFDRVGGMVPPQGLKTFTSEASLELAHRLRRRADGLITGSGTILADRPEFTVRRVADHPGKRRMLGILDRRGRTPSSYLEAARARGFDPMVAGDIDALLAAFADRGVLEALIEAGPTVSEAFLARGLWDEQVLIRQGAGTGEPDRVEIIARGAN